MARREWQGIWHLQQAASSQRSNYLPWIFQNLEMVRMQATRQSLGLRTDGKRLEGYGNWNTHNRVVELSVEAELLLS